MTGGPELTLLSLHQRDATLDVRERFAAAVAPVTGPDVLVTATCHRAEIALALPPAADVREAISQRLAVALPVEARVRTGRAALLHLIRVACGLDSVIRGEAQVLGQLRRTFDAARERGPLDPLLGRAVQRALQVGRELRRTTPLGSVRRTLGSLAVDAALAGVADPPRATILVVGAGEVGKLALRALAARVGAVVVVNRDFARAKALAMEHGATAEPLDRIDELLDRADAVIAAADTRGAVLTTERLSLRAARGPLTIVDLAVPRSVEAAARSLPGLTYVDVDALADVAAPELDAAALADLEERCAGAVDDLMRELAERRAAPIIRALHARTEDIRKEQLERALSRLGHLSERDRAVVEALSEALAHAIVHEPTVRLREAPEREAAARDLFAL